MTGDTKTLIVERLLPFPAERIWRALTVPHLMAEWLMKGDFAPQVGHRFQLTSDHVTVAHVTVDCQVRLVEEGRVLAYTWDAYGLESVVTWTLTPVPEGTLLRMEQAGFRRDQGQAYGGARQGWQRFLDRMEQVLLGRME